MTLTPADVRAVAFRATRLRAGYDMDEVDEFLDAVQETVGHLEVDVARHREAESVLLVRCEQLQARIAFLEQQDRAATARDRNDQSAGLIRGPSEIEGSLAARCEALQSRVNSLEAELAAATRAANQLAVAGDIASRNTQVLSARTGEVESALAARCEALQARLSLLEAELAAANRAAQDHAARRAAVEELAASQKAAIDLAASSANAQSERSREVEAALTARCEALQSKVLLLEEQLASANRVLEASAAAERTAAERASVELAAAGAEAQAERARAVESALTARCEALQERIELLERQVTIVGEPAEVLGAAQATAEELVRAATEYAAAIRSSAAAAPRDEEP
jgi:DivIVA domain-containing protein